MKGVLAEMNASQQYIGVEPEMQEIMVCEPDQSDCVTFTIQRLWMPEGIQHELHAERNSDLFICRLPWERPTEGESLPSLQPRSRVFSGWT